MSAAPIAKPPPSGFVSIDDSKRSFPVRAPGFVQTKEVRVMASHVVVLELEDGDFQPGARNFQDLRVDGTNLRGAARAVLMQLWCFGLYVMQCRINRSDTRAVDYPVKVYLEMLSTKAGDTVTATNGMRLWIFVQPGHDINMLYEIIKTAVVSDKTLDLDGNFMDTNKKAGSAGTTAAADPAAGQPLPLTMPGAPVASHKRGNGKGGPETPTVAADEGPKVNALYKLVVDGPALAAVVDGVTGRVHNTRQANSMNLALIDILGASTLRRTFRRTDKKVFLGQRTPERYLGKADPRDEKVREYVLPFFDNVFQILPYCFRPEYFFTRNMPWWEVTKKQSNWSRFIVETVQVVRALRANPNASSLPPLNLDGDDDDDDEDEDDIDVPLVEGESRSSHAALRRMVFQKPQKLTDEQLGDVMRHYGFIVDKKQPTKLNDYVAALGRVFMVQEELIRERYESDPRKMESVLETLVDQMLDKFEATCMHEHSEVSKVQQTLNAEFRDKKLADRHLLITRSDPSKTPIENFLIFLEAGFTVHGGVATSQHICSLAFLMSADRFRRELNLHANLLFCGPNAAGKSHIMDMVMRCISRMSCSIANSSSDQADAYTHEDSDVMRMADDISTKTECDPDKQERSAQSKSQMTTMQTSRDVLKLEPTRHRVTEIGTEVRCRMAGTNESISTAMKNSKQYKRGTLAWWNRWMCLEIPKHENPLFNVGDRMAFEEARTPEMEAESDDFFLGMQRAHTVLGWVEKLMDISKRIIHLDMSCFNLVWNKLTAGLSRHGLKASHPRIREQARILCRQLVLMEQYVMQNCFADSPHYGERFNIRQVKDWTPICFEHHVILTMSFFFYDFYPPVMTPVFDVLQKLADEAIAGGGDSRVRVPSLYHARQDAKRRQEEERHEQARAAADQAAEARRRQEEAAKQLQMDLLLDRISKENAPNAGSAREMAILEASIQGLNMRSSGAVAAQGTAARRQQPTIAQQLAAQAAAARQPPPPSQPEVTVTECGMIEFKCSEEQLAEMISLRMQQTQTRVTWGDDAILMAIERMKKMVVEHSKWGMRTLTEESRPEKIDSRRRVKSPVLSVTNAQSILVPYGVLREDHDDLCVFKGVLTSYCSRQTQPREIILAIDHPRYPWVYQSAHMIRGTHDLVVSNPRHVDGYHGSVLGGKRRMEPAMLRIDVEINTMVAMNYFGRFMDLGVVTLDHVLDITPEAVVRRQMDYAAETLHLKPESVNLLQDYPRDAEEYFTLREIVALRMSRDEDAILNPDAPPMPVASNDFVIPPDIAFDARGNPILSDAALDRMLVTRQNRIDVHPDDYNRPRVRVIFGEACDIASVRDTLVKRKVQVDDDTDAEQEARDRMAMIRRSSKAHQSVRVDIKILKAGKWLRGHFTDEQITARHEETVRRNKTGLSFFSAARNGIMADHAALGRTAAAQREEEQQVVDEYNDFMAQKESRRERAREAPGAAGDDDDDDDDDGMDFFNADEPASAGDDDDAEITESQAKRLKEDFDAVYAAVDMDE